MKTEIALNKGILSILARDFKFSQNTFEEKQKSVDTIYLLQATGFRLGYGFDWYKHGPFSGELLDDLHEVLTYSRDYEITKDKTKWNFNKSSWERIMDVDSKFIKPLNDLRKSELVNSLHFMYVHWSENRSPYEMKQFFRKQHVDYTRYDKSLITDKELDNALVDACNLIAYKNYYENQSFNK